MQSNRMAALLAVFALVSSCAGWRDGADDDGATGGNQTPTASFTASPASGDAPLAVAFDASGSSDPDGTVASYAWAFGDSATATGASTSHTYAAAGTYTAVLTVTDNGGATGTASRTITVTAPPVNQSPVASFTAAPTSGDAPLTVAFDASGSSDPDGTVASYAWAFGDSASATGAATSHTYAAAGTYTAVLTVTDNGGATGTTSRTITVSVPAGLPPDPATVAPPVDPTVATTLAAATAFLYTGTNPIQTGVAPGTIKPVRAAVLRGRVTDRSAAALSGVLISVLGHSELGVTLTRADGRFDLAVNGGGLLTVEYAKPGFLPAQRQIGAPWQDYAALPDVVMIPVDPQVTAIDLGAGVSIQVARGSEVTDGDGTRRATVFFPQGLTAQMVLAGGGSQPLTTLNVRATEYTVGPNGPLAMPATLPPTSMYTYAVELSTDEGISAGATSVRFDRPVPFYLENFIGFPVGTPVPSGFYDRSKAAWVPSDNGRVIAVLGATSGVADLDTDGDGAADGAAQLASLGITDAERTELATLYPAGRTLWRVPIRHFSPVDFNWPYGPPADAAAPTDAAGDEDSPLEDPCLSQGSILECDNQVLGETVGLVGTPYSLNYRSDRVPGRAKSLGITLSGAAVPASLRSIGLRVSVAGKTTEQTFPPDSNRSTTFTWDGLDAYGRPAQGGQVARVSVDYTYPAEFKIPANLDPAFASFGGAAILGASRAASSVTLSQPFTAVLGNGLTDARAVGLGGWTLNAHHFYDPVARVLHLGDGSRRGAESVGRILDTVISRQNLPGITGELTGALAVGPDGSIYFARFDQRLRRLAPDGTETVVAGGGTAGAPNFGDGGPATEATLNTDPEFVTLGSDGSLYLSDANVIRRVGPDGIIRRVAGIYSFDGSGCAASAGPDGGPATETRLCVADVAVGPDGTLYMREVFSDPATFPPQDLTRLRKVGPDGIITTLAGGLAACDTFVETACGDGGPAAAAKLGTSGNGLTVGPDGSVLFGDEVRIRRVTPDGIIGTFAGGFTSAFAGDGGSASDARFCNVTGLAFAPDGSLLVADSSNSRLRRIGPDAIVSTIAGSETVCTFNSAKSGDQGPSLLARLGTPQRAVAAPDGTVYAAVGTPTSIRRVRVGLPDFEDVAFIVPSADGREHYGFDSFGRHLRTLNALTGAVLLTFGYDAQGRLAQVVQKTSGTDTVTTIEHGATGGPTAIVGPFGQRTLLAVDPEGYLAEITNPAGEAMQFGYSASGLLTSATDPRGAVSTFTYDPNGRLLRDTDPVGGFQTLARTSAPKRSTVTRVTAMGRTTSHEVENRPGSVRVRTVTAPDGRVTVGQETLDAGSKVLHAPDGTVFRVQLGPDPRFGMAAPVESSVDVTLPGGTTNAATNTESAVLSDPADPLSLATLTATSSTNGRVWTTAYTAATSSFAATTPTGRTASAVVDALGRLVSEQQTGLFGRSFTYDGFGRVETVVQGSGAEARTTSLAHNPQGFPASITDAVGRSAQFVYDAAGRVTAKTLADGETVTYAYDAAGNLVSVTPPGGRPYTFGYSDRGELTLVAPPTVPGTGPTAYSYDLDRQLTLISMPDNRAVALGYDANGRVTTRELSTNGSVTATDVVAYNADGRVASIAGAGGVTTSYGYDGPFRTTEAWTGLVSGNVTRAFDSSFRLASQSVNGSNLINFAYDNDDLLIGAGDLAISTDSQTGLPVGSTLGVVVTSTSYNGFGEVTGYGAAAVGNGVFNLNLTRDKLGRISQKTTAIGGTTQTFTYVYDLAGQLVRVSIDGVETETYGYDSKGNRISATVGGKSVTAIYDDQDRLTSYGAAVYAYDGTGNLLSKSDAGQTTTYQYDPLGNLLRVSLPDGRVIEYVVDGLGRRVGKKLNGTLARGFLYSGKRLPIAELDGNGALTSRFVFTNKGAPAYMIKDGAAHRFVTDEVGSVRLVVNTQTGIVTQRLDYDSFGNVTQDTNPGFQPFGFAGGLYDPDTGLVRFGRRDYDPNTGRWTAKEPVWVFRGETNLYRYAHNNPVNRVDRDGMEDDPVPRKPSESEYCKCFGTGTTSSCLPGSGKAGEIADFLEKVAAKAEDEGSNPDAAFAGACMARDIYEAIFVGDVEKRWETGMCHVGGAEGVCYDDDEQSIGQPAPPTLPKARKSRRPSTPPLPPCIIENDRIRRPVPTDTL